MNAHFSSTNKVFAENELPQLLLYGTLKLS